MKIFALFALVALLGVAAQAKDDCTDEPKINWMPEADFKKKVESEGIKIRNFKQPGTCYEVYGTNKQGHRVEIYYDPTDGSVVKSYTKK